MTDRDRMLTAPLPGKPLDVEPAVIDGVPTLLITQDGYLIGRFTSPERAAAAGIDLASLREKACR